MDNIILTARGTNLTESLQKVCVTCPPIWHNHTTCDLRPVYSRFVPDAALHSLVGNITYIQVKVLLARHPITLDPGK